MNNREKDQLVGRVVEEIYKAHPTLWDRFGQNGRDRTEEDNYHHIDHLYASYEMKSAEFFLDYTSWLENVLTSRGVGTELIIDNYERLIRHLVVMDWEDEREKDSFINHLKLALENLRE
ncbi:hypothetical protein GCM10010954_34350 [Halobacillus andaensis]|uniref:Uncharacterized protein n=1 Tax=Halobacillus andaensis TaxID=1176239 RepID=A0A917BA47_HALAA|nr:hypothetical protein [Halobacillus andaensis]MBP2005542.1 hypothetical protein [Halobacillus andaensis]GGF32275.1 hypothetical protein GCM10010954_34350 [Halobacillus andaensis]